MLQFSDLIIETIVASHSMAVELDAGSKKTPKKWMKIGSFLRPQVFRGFLFGLFVLILTGCEEEVKTLPPLDEKMAKEECAILVIPSDISVKRIDDESSSWSGGKKAAKLLVPAGKHTITINYSQPLEEISAQNLKYTANMAAGKMYMASVTHKKGNIDIFSKAISKGVLLVQDELIDDHPWLGFIYRKDVALDYHITEINQEMFDLYLQNWTSDIGFLLLIFLIVMVWLFLPFFLSEMFLPLFMSNLKKRHKYVANIIGIVSGIAGFIIFCIIIIQYDLSSKFLLYLLSITLFGISLSSSAKET